MGVTFPKTLQVNRMGKGKLKYIMTWLFNCNDLFLMYFYFLHSDLLQYHFFLFEAAWNSVAFMCKQGTWNQRWHRPTHPNQFTVSLSKMSGVFTRRHFFCLSKSQGAAGAMYLDTKAHLSWVTPQLWDFPKLFHKVCRDCHSFFVHYFHGPGFPVDQLRVGSGGHFPL